jgi:hypothetical protein
MGTKLKAAKQEGSCRAEVTLTVPCRVRLPPCLTQKGIDHLKQEILAGRAKLETARGNRFGVWASYKDGTESYRAAVLTVTIDQLSPKAARKALLALAHTL